MIADWVTTIAALIATAAPGVPSPVPSPPPAVKTITQVKSSPVCTEFRSLVLPLALVQQRNNGLMQMIRGETQQYRKYSNSAFRNGMLLHASNIDMAAATILRNLSVMDQFLAASWKRSPKGANPKIDALRQRVQNVIDLQRAVANREVQFGGFVKDTDGMDELASAADAFGKAGLHADSPASASPNAAQVAASSSPPPPPDDATTLPSYSAGLAPAGTDLLPEADPRVPSTTSSSFAARSMSRYSFASLAETLQQESTSLVPIASVLAHDCDGI